MRARIAKIIDAVSVTIVVSAAVVLLVAMAGRSGRFADDRRAMNDSTFYTFTNSANWLGSPDAPVVFLVYSTYSCGYCGEIDESLAALRERYPAYVAVAIKQFIESSEPGIGIALGAECAARQGHFATYHRAAFDSASLINYPTGWARVGRAVPGLDQVEFGECVRSKRYLGKVESELDEARRLGVRATPTFFVNGWVGVGAAPLQVLDSLVAFAMARKGAVDTTRWSDGGVVSDSATAR